MENYPVTQAHTVFLVLAVIFLTSLCSYAWTSWRIQTERIREQQSKPALSKLIGRCRNAMSAKGINVIHHMRSGSSLVGEWIAPLIAWAVVGMTVLAILGLLFGEQ